MGRFHGYKLWSLKPDFTKKNGGFVGLNDDLMGIQWELNGF